MKGAGQHVVSVVVGAVFAAIGTALALRVQDASGVVGVVFAVVGLGLVANGARDLLAQSAFEQLHLEVLGPVPLGGRAELHLVLIPKRPLTLGGASKLTLVCTEKAVYSAGTSSRTYTDVVYSREDLLDLPPTLSQPVDRRLTVSIPPHLPPTWRGRSNSFVTTVQVRVDVDKWPDLFLEAEVVVLPEVALV